jgi:signal transduction histidine kinase
MSLHQAFGTINDPDRMPGGSRAVRLPDQPESIVLIDDDEDAARMLATRLHSAGYEVTHFVDAERALEALRTMRPSLILLDLMLPGMDGWQFRIEQKQVPALIDVPVIALSGDSSPFAAAIDADAYLTKPVDFAHLRSVIEHILLANEQRRLSAKAVELERLDSLGMLVKSLGHEINNPLTGMVGNLQKAMRMCSYNGAERIAVPAEPLMQVLERAYEGAQRVAFVVHLLSTFGDDVSSVPASDPLRALDAATRLAAHHMERRAHLIAHLEPVPFVRVSEGRLAQVFLNLLINAAQAIPEGEANRHEIRVRLRAEESDVVVDIEDTGCGVAPELLAKIFEPFYTTKPAGKGTGLGLSISRDIVMRCGGSISVASQPGLGSTFSVRLPIYRDREKLREFRPLS